MFQLNVKITDKMLAAIDRVRDDTIQETRQMVVKRAVKDYLLIRGVQIENVIEND